MPRFLARKCRLHLLPGFAALVLAAAPTMAAYGQRVAARTLADSVSVGERFLLTVAAEHNGVAEIAFPDPARGDSAFGDVVLIRRQLEGQVRPDPNNPDVRVDSVVYEAAAFALDSAYVAPIPVRFTTPGRTYNVATRPFSIPVRSTVPADAGQPRDLAPIVEFQRPWWHWALVAAGVLALAALVAWLVRKHFRKQEPEPSYAPPVHAGTPYEQAEARLRALERVDLAQPEAVKPFYVELSDVLRTYLAARLGVPAMELTTREFLALLARPTPHAPAPIVETERLRRILGTTDLVKFADARPDPATGRSLIEEARVLLRDVESVLRPAPEPLAPAESA